MPGHPYLVATARRRVAQITRADCRSWKAPPRCAPLSTCLVLFVDKKYRSLHYSWTGGCGLLCRMFMLRERGVLLDIYLVDVILAFSRLEYEV